MKLSPKYFRVRLTAVLCPLLTLAFTCVNCFLLEVYFSAEVNERADRSWTIILMIALNLFFIFLSILAIYTYKTTFWKGDKVVWKNSKCRFIKRFLNEPYSK